MASLSPEQRAELGELMEQAMGDLDLSAQMSQLGDQLRELRPDLDRSQPGHGCAATSPWGSARPPTALEELADLEALEGSLGQDYAGASLDDVDEEAVRRALGRQAVDDLDQLRRIERELEAQGYLTRETASWSCPPRPCAGSVGPRCARCSRRCRPGARRPTTSATPARPASSPARRGRGSSATSSRSTSCAPSPTRCSARGRAGRVARCGSSVDDFEVRETERRTSAAVCLLVDLSYSMVLNGTWGPAKQTALALHTLVSTSYPQDALQIIGFSNYARELQPAELAGLDWDMVQGTNLQHALLLAGRFIDRHPDSDPVVLVVTDGEPTAHLTRDGHSAFYWPPTPETLALTLAEVDKMTRRGATLNIFMLGDEDRLQRFVDEVARRNGGRVFNPDADRLGDFVVSDFLRVPPGHRPSPPLRLISPQRGNLPGLMTGDLPRCERMAAS